jgi:hypothetical protein
MCKRDLSTFSHMEPMSRALVYGENYDLVQEVKFLWCKMGVFKPYQHEKRIQRAMTKKKISHILQVEKRPYVEKEEM